MTKTTKSLVPLLAANLFLLWGLFFEGWSVLTVFSVYLAETVLVGLITIIGLFIRTYSNKPQANEASGRQAVSGLALRFFFHYNFIVAVQLLVFSVSISLLMPSSPDADGFSEFFHPFSQDGFLITMAALAVGHFISLMGRHFSGGLAQFSVDELAAEPYLRVFVQQFAIILGGFALILLARFSTQAVIVAFGMVFILAKLVFEVNYQQLVKKGILYQGGFLNNNSGL